MRPTGRRADSSTEDLTTRPEDLTRFGQLACFLLEGTRRTLAGATWHIWQCSMMVVLQRKERCTSHQQPVSHRGVLSLKDESRLLSVTVTVTATPRLTTVIFPFTCVQSAAKLLFWATVAHCRAQHAGSIRSTILGTALHYSGCAQEASTIEQGQSLDRCRESRAINTGFCSLAKPNRSRCGRSTFAQYIPQSSLHPDIGTPRERDVSRRG